MTGSNTYPQSTASRTRTMRSFLLALTKERRPIQSQIRRFVGRSIEARAASTRDPRSLSSISPSFRPSRGCSHGLGTIFDQAVLLTVVFACLRKCIVTSSIFHRIPSPVKRPQVQSYDCQCRFQRIRKSTGRAEPLPRAKGSQGKLYNLSYDASASVCACQDFKICCI